MGYLRTYSFVCLHCKKSFKRNCDTSEYVEELVCPDCGNTAYNFGRNFHAPKKSDQQQWKKIQFLFDSGFRFQRIRNDLGERVEYPKTLEEAKEFVDKYKDKALKN